MDTSEIESMIAERLGDSHAESDLHDLLSAVAEGQGVSASEDDLSKGTTFIVAYLEQVPYMMKIAWISARNVGLEGPMKHILDRVDYYWKQDDDIIPDYLGIVGLLDDAYCSLSSLQAVSDHYQLQTGKYLFPDDMSSANRAMRRIIGEPYGTELDQLIIKTMQEAGMVDAMKSLASEEKQIGFANQSTIWNHGPVSNMKIDDLDGLGLTEE